MMKRSKISGLLFIAANVLILGLCVVSYLRLKTLTDSSGWINHTQVVKLTLEKILSSLNDAESHQRGFILTHDSSFLAEKKLALIRVSSDMHALDSLVKDNPEQKANANRLREKIKERIEAFSYVLKNFASVVILPELKNETQNGKLIMQNVKRTMNEMTYEEDALLTQRTRNYEHQLKLAPASLFGLSLAALVVLFIAFYLLRQSLEKSQRLQLSEHLLEEKVKERTAELLRRNIFVETILNSSIDLIVVYDLEMKILSFNAASEKFFKMKQEDVLGKYYYEVFPGTKDKQGYNDLTRSLKGETIHNPRYFSATTNRIFENYLLPLKHADGSVYAAIVIAHDYTELINATEQVKAVNLALETRNRFVEDLINASPDVVFVVNKEQKILTVNNKSARRFKRLYEGSPIGKKITEVVPSLENSVIQNDILKAFTGETVIRESYQSPYTGESYIQSYIPLKNDTGVYAVMAVSHNITELVNTAAELRKTNEVLEKTNDELSSFAHIASHDLQEPLRKIQMFVQRIRAKEVERLSEEGQSHFSRIENSSRRMQKLIIDLLAYSRATTVEQHFEDTDLNLILEQVKSDLKEKIEDNKAIIEADKLPRLSIIPFQFQQLFTNLISNSIKFCKPGEPVHIRITSEIADETRLAEINAAPDTQYHQIAFGDNGIGFDESYKERIFKLFQRLHGRNEYEGTGIGLSIVKKIVENHQGIITANSQPGNGAIFTMYFPVV